MGTFILSSPEDFDEPEYEEPKIVASKTAEKPQYKIYTVQKNDTLQKISYKFYNTTRRWKKIYDAKIDELQRRKLLFPPITKKTLLECQGRIMRQIMTGNKNFNVLSGASACAMAIKVQHAIELLETQTLYSFHLYI